MKQTFTVLMVASLLSMMSCKKKDDSGSGVSISTVTPARSYGGDTVFISGNGFSSNIASDQVTFNGKTATVLAATGDSLQVIVPLKAGTGAVSVTVNGRSVTGPLFGYDTIGFVTTFAGSTAGYADGAGTAAQFNAPVGICIDSQGNLYVADDGNSKIRKITPAGVVSTIAGGGSGYADGTGSAAQFRVPIGICVNAQGMLYVTDEANHDIRAITPGGAVTTLAGTGGLASSGYADGTGAAAKFNTPSGICVDAQGNIYVTELVNKLLRKITPAGVVTTLTDNSSIQYSFPTNVYYDPTGILYVSDNDNILKVSPAGVITNFTWTAPDLSSVPFGSPAGIVTDAAGNLYVCSSGTNSIQKITQGGTMGLVAGNGMTGFADGSGTTAQFASPAGICMDVQGNLYVADARNNRIRKIVLQ